MALTPSQQRNKDREEAKLAAGAAGSTLDNSKKDPKDPIQAAEELANKDSIIASLKAKLAEATGLLDSAATEEAVDIKKQLVLNRIMKRHHFFYSQIPNISMVLPNQALDTVAFVPRTRISNMDTRTGEVTGSTSWGEFYTENREIAAYIDQACIDNPKVRRMTNEEVADVRTNISMG